tara:strand:- start:679 stop:879 length:201 start_codon:yes stop_codon:yes gene_type:complete
MKYLAAIWLLVVIGCGIFNPGDDYNPNYTPKPETVVETLQDSIRVDTIHLTNGIDHIIMLDTVRIK